MDDGPGDAVTSRVEAIASDGFDVRKFVENFEVLAQAQGGVRKLRELAIELAVEGLRSCSDHRTTRTSTPTALATLAQTRPP